MNLEEKNNLYKKVSTVRLTDKQITELLKSGLEPEFRSLAGILQAAAEMGAMQVYDKLVE